MWRALYLIFTLSVLIPGTIQAKGKTKNIADYFTLCNRNDPNISDCVKNSILEAKSKLIEGITDLQLVRMDPMHIPLLEFKDGEGNFEFKMTMKNVTMEGLKNFEIIHCSQDTSKHYLELDMFTPFLKIEGQYEVSGKILVVPIQGNGDVVFNFTDVITRSKTQSKIVEKNGVEYVPIEEMKWNFEVGHMQSHFSNLFNGDPVLGESTNKFLNENAKEAFETLKALPEEAFGQLFKTLGNKVFERFPYDEIYPK